jgi:hypothetical protein
VELSLEHDLAKTTAFNQAALACVAQSRELDAKLLTRSHLRLVASHELLRKPVRALIVARG